ncbi:putative GIY-YIG family homing endonuclease [Erwinia phage vB_EamM_RisingSun]|uniref:Putative GIY-YIG family homing endonuclease n=1 Tax=Erwinia phage vB_EamM_RisingSun TaxID=2026080 RepID=A0A223LHY3_9CAUD|nr:putative GIY-YIG family homing endonuclease [Erwinia phage vB_EamM_RisingSun]ASU03483.1 putative GIY-YIG family homing endonuclease [Erwinia phage vB_EamM_RisingSun]
MEAVCYILSFKKEGKVKTYIGHTVEFDKRLARHLRELKQGNHHNSELQALYNEGWEFDSHKLIPVKNKVLAHKLEQEHILNSQNNPDVVNIECGNDTYTNNPRKEEIRVKLITHLKNFMDSLSEEEKKEVYGRVGEENGMYGSTHSEEARKIISEKVKAYYETHDAPAKGRKLTDEQRALLSILASNRTGESNPFYGKTHSDETRKKIAEAKKGNLPVNSKQVSINGVVYKSMSEGARDVGVNPTVALWRIKSVNPKYADWKWV